MQAFSLLYGCDLIIGRELQSLGSAEIEISEDIVNLFLFSSGSGRRRRSKS